MCIYCLLYCSQVGLKCAFRAVTPLLPPITLRPLLTPMAVGGCNRLSLARNLFIASIARPSARTSWHYVYCFNPSSFDYIRSLTKGSKVYVEANYELREPDASAEPGSPQGQRQIFLRHGESPFRQVHEFSLTLIQQKRFDCYQVAGRSQRQSPKERQSQRIRSFVTISPCS